MILKIGLGAKPDLPLVLDFDKLLTQFWAFLPNQTGIRFPIELVGLAGPIRFLKPCS